MNFVRCRLSVRNLLGQRIRGMCSNKVQETKAESSPAASAQDSRPLFKVPGYRPSEMDKKILIWAGRFKSADQIPETVSFEMIDSARNRIRVKAAYVMMAMTLGACVLMVVMGKKAAGRNESLTLYNMEKKAKWKEQTEKGEASGDALPQKAQ
ncbi:protein FAM162B [Kryptolebias marmoratus]|uniref:Family with sequence similarity 162 member A n=1 Tax=Kryptolebias marmoratus TaxID=37003 RepID=A0A3Q3APC6_KRYMA|nr:protein FAM162B [Kryptolebias marmoratus]